MRKTNPGPTAAGLFVRPWMTRCLVAIGLTLGCTNTTHAEKTNSEVDIGKVVESVGIIQAPMSAGKSPPVVVFEEYHTSCLGQLEIAVMLVRLHDHHGLVSIGLEGAIQRERPLDAKWFRRGGNAGQGDPREDVAVAMLAEGEISAAEFMALLFADVEVFGIEAAQEYEQKLDVKGSPELSYLLAIAEKNLAPTDIQKINSLVGEKKNDDAIEYMLTRDSWVRKQYEALKKGGPSSAEDMVRRAREIQDKAQQSKAQIKPEVQQDLEKEIAFFETASKRSVTMTEYMVQTHSTSSPQLSAMQVGAAHSEKVIETLRARNVACALVRPVDLDPDHGSISTEEFERKSSGRWARTYGGSLGRLLNSQRKPPPVIETATGKSYGNAMLASRVIAMAARKGQPVPQSVREQLDRLEEIKVDWDSFTQDGFDVIYRMWLTKTDGKSVEVWARVGSLADEDKSASLVEKLMKKIADLGGGNKRPPGKPPGTSGTAEADPERGKQDKGSELHVAATGLDTLAIYASTREEVARATRVSS
jgi:hypothetical protein